MLRRKIVLAKVNAVCTGGAGDVDSIIDDDLYAALPCVCDRLNRRGVKLTCGPVLLAELDQSRTAIDQTSHLFEMRETGDASVGDRIDFRKVVTQET